MLRQFLLCCLLTLCLTTPVHADDAASLADQINALAPGWTAGPTSVSNLPWDQKLARCGTLRGNGGLTTLNARDVLPAPLPDVTLPPAWDWRDVQGRNFITPVRDQQGCGGCWSFCTVAAFESRLIMDWNMDPAPLDLSEQALISCSLAGNCLDGGYMVPAAKQIALTGIPSEECFPYYSWDAPCAIGCAEQTSWAAAFTTHSPRFPAQDVQDLKAHLVAYGPVAVGMQVFEDFDYYTGGVYRHVAGESTGGHGVCVVGYDDAEQCFIVKNSWGEGWGEEGYFRIGYDQVDNDVMFGFDAACFASSAHPGYQVIPLIFVDRSWQEGAASVDDKVSVSVSLLTGVQSDKPMEWWVVWYETDNPDDDEPSYTPRRSYVAGRGWVDGLQPMQVAPGKMILPLTVLKRHLPEGTHGFAFALDSNPDGQFQPAWQSFQIVTVYGDDDDDNGGGDE